MGGDEPAVATVSVRSVVEYGPAFELALAALERASGFADTRDVFLLRHRATFVACWIGAVAFYFLLRRTLRDDLFALAGTAAFLLAPRQLADSFYNTKDAVLLALFAVGTLTLVRFVDRPSLGRLLIHAVVSAFAVDVRLVGLLLPALTFLCLWLAGWERRMAPSALRSAATSSVAYGVAVSALVVLFWPQLWADPVGGLGSALSRLGSAQQLDNPFVLYAGRFVGVDALPWHYLPTWIALTTPPWMLVVFGVGLIGCALALHRRGPLHASNRIVLVALLGLAIPLATVVTLRPVLYDGWRHFYFLHAAIVLVAFLGTLEIVRGPGFRRLALGAISVGLLWTAFTIVALHPHQQVYFNAMAPAEVERQFEIDYWGLSYRDGLEEILRREPAGTIDVAVADLPGFLNAMILPAPDRARIRFTPVREASYFLSNHRQPRQHERFLARAGPYADEVHAVRAGGAHLLGVYRIRDTASPSLPAAPSP